MIQYYLDDGSMLTVTVYYMQVSRDELISDPSAFPCPADIVAQLDSKLEPSVNNVSLIFIFQPH